MLACLALTWHGMAWRMNELGMENELVKFYLFPPKQWWERDRGKLQS